MSAAEERQTHNAGGSGILHFPHEVLENMDKALEQLLEDSQAKCAMVIDRTGCILSSAGDFHPMSQDNMGAVAAGVIAAINTMVDQASSPEVSVKLYGSPVDKIHFVLLAERLILCMIHSNHTTTGQVRAGARAFANRMLPIIAKERVSDSQGANLAKSINFIENKISEMFKDFT